MGRGIRTLDTPEQTPYFPIGLAYAHAELALRGINCPPYSDLPEVARANGIVLYPFKRLAGSNARVRESLGMILGLAPVNLLDVGSGRGLLLWPLSETRPYFTVTAVDTSLESVTRLKSAFQAFGLDWQAQHADVELLPFKDASYDVVTAFEVLEHVADPVQALRQLWRVTKRALCLSFPRLPDDCPDHKRIFDRELVSVTMQLAGVDSYKLMADRFRHFVIAHKGL